MALHQSKLVVGAPDSNDKTGTAHIFVDDGSASSWTEQIVLAAPEEIPGAYFGWSVAIHQDTVVVGVPYTRRGRLAIEYTGGAYIYVWNEVSTAWLEASQADFFV